MAKKRKNLSELKNKPPAGKKALNPFEVHVNRQKFQVLGRQLKSDRGLPGVARAKALKKRKETLLQEYKVINKSNKFFDKRIGEKNSAMTKEDRIIARFSAERMKSLKKKNIFNLADDEVLTHKGQSIAEIEKFEDPPSDGEDDVKGLDANFVGEANFGGGVLRESKTNRQSIIEELIAESKKRKAERQMAKEKTLQKTEELDAEWKELIPLVGLGKQEDLPVEKKDPYDVIVSDLKFQPRATPTDKLKTESELAEEEAQRLKELEEERLRRMRGDDSPSSSSNKSRHRSADDLDDGFEIEEEKFELTYDQEGNPLDPEKIEALKNEHRLKVDEKGDIESNDEESEDEEDEEENEEEEENDELNSKKVEEGEEEEKASDSEEDDLSDLKPKDEGKDHESASEGEEETARPQPKPSLSEQGEVKVKHKKVSFNDEVMISYGNSFKKSPEEIEKEKEERKKDMEKARQELPYTFEVPESYEPLQDLLHNKNPNQQAVIIERMIKCNHPSLNEKNKEKMDNLFALLMQHLNDASYSDCWPLLDRLAPYLFDLTQFSPPNAAYCLTEVLKEKYSDYLKKKLKYPPPEVLVYLKLVSLLFPTSDKRHCVTTPAYLFIAHILGSSLVTTRRAIATGLYLVTLLTEYVSFSKRIMPESINFICGIIHMATPATNLPVTPPFKKEHKLLFLHQSHHDMEETNFGMEGSDLEPSVGTKIDDSFRVRSLYCALRLALNFASLYQSHPASRLLLKPLKNHLEALEIEKYPKCVKDVYNGLSEILSAIMRKELTPIVMEAKKPKALRLYEPSIQPVYDSKNKNLPPEKAEHCKLLQKFKTEMKGAMREIRRDREFLSKVRFKEQAASDEQRKRKVKEIYAWGAQQQSEINKLKRKRRK